MYDYNIGLFKTLLCKIQIISFSEYVMQRFASGVPQDNGVTRRVRRCAAQVWGKVENRREKFEEKIVEVNFGITLYFSKKADKNENSNSLIKNIL